MTHVDIVQVQDSIRRSQPSKKAELEEELKGWTEQLTLYQSLLPKESQAKAIREREIPALEAQVAAEEAKLQTASAEAEAVSTSLECRALFHVLHIVA